MAAASENSENVDVKISPCETTFEVSENNCFVKLTDLKVAELKCELEKRNLDKNGVKSVLTERLKNALLEEGKDPEKFSFGNSDDSTPSKDSQRKKNSDSKTNGEMDTSSKSDEFPCKLNNFSSSDINESTDADVGRSADAELIKEAESEINKSEVPEGNESISSECDKSDSENGKCIDSEKSKSVDSKKSLSVDQDKNNSADLEKSKLVNTEKSKPVESGEIIPIQAKKNKSVDTDDSENIVSEGTESIDLEMNKSDDKLDDLKVNNCVDDVNNSAELEINNSEYLELTSAEDKISCEVTLELSIDEEEAQLNEDENIIDIPKNIDESKLKSKEATKPILETNCSENTSETIVQTSPEKTKATSEDNKERKIAKTPVHSKPFESSVSPKVLKVIGKNDKMKNANVLAKSLWVTSLPTTTRAADLKTLFSKQGRVMSVKIVKSTKQTPGKCYGFVTMATSTDATKAIQNLHGIELNGRRISVERTQSEPGALLKKSESKLSTAAKKQTVKKDITKTNDSAYKSLINSASKTTSKTDTKSLDKKTEDSTKVKEDKRKSSEKGKSKERDQKSRDIKERHTRRPLHRPASSRSRPFPFGERHRYGTFGRVLASKPYTSRSGLGSSFRPRSDMSLYARFREDRIRQRERFRERERREVERRHAVEISRHKYIERKQREEAYRLEREKEKLRMERELLERERMEMLKLEREKQLLERARLEREREALRRQAALSHSIKRPRVIHESGEFFEERKKSRYEERSSFRGGKLREDAPSTSRYDFPARETSRSIGRHEFERHPERFSSSKVFVPSSRSDFGDRDIRREVSIRTREERRVFQRSDVRDRDHKRSMASRERHSSSRREPSRSIDWKHERRVHEKIVAPRSSGQRRMTYY